MRDKTARLGLMIALYVDPPLFLWLGCARIKVGISITDTTGTTFLGAGRLTNMPAFQQLINGQADTVELSLATRDTRIIELVNTAPDVQDKKCDFGYLIFDKNWQPYSTVRWIRRGYADSLGFTQIGASSPDQYTTRIARLKVSSLMTGRKRPIPGYWVSWDQQARPGSSDDHAFDRVEGMSMQAQKYWPRP